MASKITMTQWTCYTFFVLVLLVISSNMIDSDLVSSVRAQLKVRAPANEGIYDGFSEAVNKGLNDGPGQAQNENRDKKCAAFLGLFTEASLDFKKEGRSLLAQLRKDKSSESEATIVPSMIAPINPERDCYGDCRFTMGELVELSAQLDNQKKYFERLHELVGMKGPFCTEPQVMSRLPVHGFFRLVNNQLLSYRISSQLGQAEKSLVGLAEIHDFLQGILKNDKYSLVSSIIYLDLLKKVREDYRHLWSLHQQLRPFKNLNAKVTALAPVSASASVSRSATVSQADLHSREQNFEGGTPDSPATAHGNSFDALSPADKNQRSLAQEALSSPLKDPRLSGEWPLQPQFERIDQEGVIEKVKEGEFQVFSAMLSDRFSDLRFRFFYLMNETLNEAYESIDRSFSSACVDFKRNNECERSTQAWVQWVRNPVGKRAIYLMEENISEHLPKLKSQVEEVNQLVL